MCTPVHYSVLLEEVKMAFADLQVESFLDATAGAGGHSLAILEAHPELSQHVCLDQDSNALAICRERLAHYTGRVDFINRNFSELKVLDRSFDGILMDLGVSHMQLKVAERGFSFQQDGPLDMRMNPDGPFSAADLVNEWEERELARIFKDYGEERFAKRVARAIVQKRQEKPFTRTLELAEVIERSKPRGKEKIHGATRCFQAIRIAVNGELEILEQALLDAIDALKPGGRLAVISFHSLEDRIVKRCFRAASLGVSDPDLVFDADARREEPLIDFWQRKPLLPSERELGENPPSRSAKLRVIQKR